MSARLRALSEPGPERLIALVTCVNSLGQGLWLTLTAIYAVTVLHLTTGQYGICVSVSAAIVLLLSIPLGHLADRVGPRSVQFWSYIVMAVLCAVLVAVHGFWPYLAVASALATAYRAGRSARKAMIAGIASGKNRLRILAYARSASNLGVTVGACLAGIVIAIGTGPAYHAALLVTGLAFLATSLLTLKEHKVPPVPAAPGAAVRVLRDWSFLVFTVLDGLLSTQGILLEVVLPLWVVQHTRAPHWMSAALLVVSATFVVLTQTRLAKDTDKPARAAAASFQGGGAVAAACLLFASTGATSLLPTCALLVAAVLAHAYGEVRLAAGSWSLAFTLAPAHAQGQYQATQAIGADLGRMFAPALFTWLVIGHGSSGWMALAAGFAVLGTSMPALVSGNPRLRAIAGEASAAEPVLAEYTSGSKPQ